MISVLAENVNDTNQIQLTPFKSKISEEIII